MLVIDDSPTILKVVQLVLTKAGFDVTIAADGEEGIRAAQAHRPTLILLDFVMPRMNGYQVCRALAENEGLKDVPVVLMSAKGDQVGERFVKVMGIVDYITKPFSPEAITGVVQHTIAKYGHRGQAGGVEETTDHGRVVPDGSTSTRAEGGNPFARRLDATAAFREELIEVLQRDELVGDVADRVREVLDDGVLDRLLTDAARAFSADEGAALRGDLSQVPIAEVLTLLAQQRQWGALSIVQPHDGRPERCRIDVCFKQGKIDLVLGHGLDDELLIGRFLVEQNAVSRADFELFLRSRSPQKPIGEQLIKLNYITEPELKTALRRQAAERIYELLRWSAGRFSFHATHELDPLALEAALGLDVDGVLMEGFRRVDEWHLIEREVDDFDAVYLRNEEAVQNVGKARLTREELAVLELVNGKNSVKDIVRQSRMGSFEVSKMLYRLYSIKLVRRRVAPVAV